MGNPHIPVGEETPDGATCPAFAFAGAGVPKRDGAKNRGSTLWNQVNNPLILSGMSSTVATPTFGTARHPFRATLPLRTLRRLPRHEPEVQARIDACHGVEAGQAPVRRSWLTAQDVRDFLLAYIACFLAVSAFLG